MNIVLVFQMVAAVMWIFLAIVGFIFLGQWHKLFRDLYNKYATELDSKK
jgi:hypothetical protein